MWEIWEIVDQKAYNSIQLLWQWSSRRSIYNISTGRHTISWAAASIILSPAAGEMGTGNIELWVQLVQISAAWPRPWWATPLVSITQRGDQNCSPRLVTRVQVRPADVMWSYLPLALSHSKKLLLIGTIIIRRRLKTSKMSPPELNDPSIKVPNFAGVTVSKFNFKLYSIMIYS